MRTAAAVVTLASTLSLATVAAADVRPSCQKAVARGGAKFARVVLKIGQRCAMRSGSAACRPAASGATGNAALDAAIERAASRLSRRVSAACKGADLDAFARRCPDPSGPPLTVDDLVACLRASHLDRVGGLIAVEFPDVSTRPAQTAGCATGQTCQCACASPSGAFLDGATPAPAVVTGSAGTCEHALSKSSAKFVGAALKNAQRCLLRASGGKGSGDACRLSAQTTGAMASGLFHAATRLRKGLAPCSDATLGAMGFDGVCKDHTPEDGFSRADLEACITETHLAAVQALLSVQFPQVTSDCGNGVIDDIEDCDPAANPTGCDVGEVCVQAGLADECTCVAAGEAVCGNGTKEADESCDPAAVPTGCPAGMTCGAAGTTGECTCTNASGSECTGECSPACATGQSCVCHCGSGTCGDGTRDPGEQCDPLANPTGCGVGLVCGAPGTPGQCSCSMQTGQCGNGVLDPGETCDPGLPNSCPAEKTCLSTCKCGVPNCNNGVKEPDEACDPSVTPTGCAAGQTCNGKCRCTGTPSPTCGNGTVDPGEQCDPASSVSGCFTGTTCTANCTCSGGPPPATCGNGTVDSGEQCDPAATPSGCAAGTTCSASCTCGSGPPPGCDCCTFGTLAFTTGTPDIGGGGCGTLKDASGATLASLDCGGLYFGGGGVAVPLPATVPDMGTSLTKIANCNATAGTFDLSATTDADTGSNRNCTSASVTNPEYPGKNGCLFGPPLPIPNANFIGASTCVINRVTSDAQGSGSCGDGASSLDLPLGSDLYLVGDLLDGSAADRPNVPGIQPCPICSGGTCKGGPNNGHACTPGSSALVDAYPTSHDCPPPGGSNVFIGTLPIPFSLTTNPSGTAPQQTKTARTVNGLEYFCGFCGSQFAPNFQGPPAKPCSSDSDCTTAPFTSCKQRTSGAFGQGSAHTVTERGTPANACVGDGAAHAATLVSVFCIPPAFNATVDANADLPGPGAVALSGEAQLR